MYEWGTCGGWEGSALTAGAWHWASSRSSSGMSRSLRFGQLSCIESVLKEGAI